MMAAMRWIQYSSNGKFHLVSHSIGLKPSVRWACNRKQYQFVCGIMVIADPDQTAARDKIYQRGIDEYCPKCLEGM